MRVHIVLFLASVALMLVGRAYGYGCYNNMPFVNGWMNPGFNGGCFCPFVNGGNVGAFQGAGYNDQTCANTYGAGNEDIKYGQNTNMANSVNADVDLNAAQQSGVESYNSRGATEYLIRNENSRSWSGSDYYNIGNANMGSSANGIFGSGNIGQSANNFNNAGGYGMFSNRGYGLGSCMNGGAWGF